MIEIGHTNEYKKPPKIAHFGLNPDDIKIIALVLTPKIGVNTKAMYRVLTPILWVHTFCIGTENLCTINHTNSPKLIFMIPYLSAKFVISFKIANDLFVTNL